jgi:hypothetical protein
MLKKANKEKKEKEDIAKSQVCPFWSKKKAYWEGNVTSLKEWHNTW